MHDLPRQKLCELIVQYGRSLCDNPRRCESLLNGYCGQYKRELFVLVSALKHHVAYELIGAPADMPKAVLLARLSSRLEDELGLTENAARWAVESWAQALGVIRRTAIPATTTAPLPKSDIGERIQPSFVGEVFISLLSDDERAKQVQPIDNHRAALTQIVQSLDEVAVKTSAAAEVAEQTIQITHENGDRAQRLVESMRAMHAHIQKIGKRIRRIGESTQEIGDILTLLHELADQLNTLALSGAIQASVAGEAGRGFAVIVDEVQRLAERSTNANKHVQRLAKTIQANVNETMITTEHVTANVTSSAA